MEIFNLKDKIEYLDEVMELEYDEWADNKENNRRIRLERKKDKFNNMSSNNSFCKLILLEGAELIGFISLFPNDCEEEKDLSPWYATMYVKKKYRKMRILKNIK